MARVYVITEAEMQGLIDQLEMKSMDNRATRYETLSADEKNRLSGVHRAFHMICVRWAQEMGFSLPRH